MKIIYINTVNTQKIYTFLYCVANDEVPSTSSQIVEQIEGIQENVFPGIFKLNQ